MDLYSKDSIQMTEYFGLFGLSLQDLARISAKALEKGGDYSDIFMEYCVSDTISIRDGQVSDISSDIDFGGGVRTLAGEKTGYAYTEVCTLEKMLSAAGYAAEIAAGGNAFIAPLTEHKALVLHNLYPVLEEEQKDRIEYKSALLSRLDQSIREADRRVTKVVARISTTLDKVLFYNSNGEYYCDFRPMCSIAANCIMEDNGRIETFYSSRSFRSGIEMITPQMLEELKNDLVDGCSRLFEARTPKGGQMPVVMAAGSSGILLHEAIGHTFEADFIRKGTSIVSDRLGQQICRKGINIVDDGTIPGNRGSINMDDEGIASQKTYMVLDGVLNSYLHDRISARHYQVASTGNGRRESFRFPPIPRMRATYMENGDADISDLIREVKHGIYVDNFSNGQVQIGAGDFTFFVKSGYMIEDGRLSYPIKDTNIIGNGPQALADILAVANDSRIDNSTWTCGKEQSVPVSCGMPGVLIRSLNVGGIE